jgi:multidrug resistance protein, MATE family
VPFTSNTHVCACFIILSTLVTGISIVVGFALGLSPLCSQAFGAGNYKRCGDLLQRQLLIHLLLTCPPIALVWWKCEYFLVLMNQPPKISKLCAQFLMWRLPGLPFTCISEDLTAFIKSQRVFVPTMFIMIGLGIATVALAALLILPQFVGLGFIGGPIAISCSNIIQAVTLVLMSEKLVSEPETWPKWSVKTAMKNWTELLALSLPSALMMWGEW